MSRILPADLVAPGLAFFLAFVAVPDHAAAQTLVTLEGTYPSAGEFSIDPPNACGFPTPFASVWVLPDPSSACGTIQNFVPPPVGLLGDSAVDALNDVVWITDGLILSAYVDGASITNVPVPAGTLLGGPVTGLGFDSANGLLWLTDGTSAAAIPAPGPGCPGLPLATIAPFVLPLGGALALDVAWDSWTGTLWVCDNTGIVTNVTTAGAIGPAGSFAPSSCGLGTVLSGIAFDSATGNLFVTDGVGIEYVTPTGAPAPPTFYAPGSPCVTPPPPGPPAALSGLAYSPRPRRYGSACATAGSPPNIDFVGSFSTSPNPAFGINLSGALPNTPTVLMLSPGAPCPSLPWGACEVLVFPFTLALFTTTDGTGKAAFPLPIPAYAPGSPLIGLNAKAQWLVLSTAGRQTTEGLAFTISSL